MLPKPAATVSVLLPIGAFDQRSVFAVEKSWGQIRVPLLLTLGIHASSWVVICAAKELNLWFPTILITQRSGSSAIVSSERFKSIGYPCRTRLAAGFGGP